MYINVYPDLAASQQAERDLKAHLDAQGFLRWVPGEGIFKHINKHQLADLEHQAARKRMEAKRARDRPPLLDHMIAAVVVVYGVAEEDFLRVGLKNDKLNDARDHLCWLARRRSVEEIHLRRLFACHHTTLTNWRGRFKPGVMSSEVARVDALLEAPR